MGEHRMRSPLSRARGLGSAKEGVEHWWMQRVTAAALIPLTLWFVASLIALTSSDYNTFIAWLRAPIRSCSHGAVADCALPSHGARSSSGS